MERGIKELLGNDQHGLQWIRVEGMHSMLVCCDELHQSLPGAVTDAKPNDLRGMPVEQTSLLKVRVLSNEDEPVIPRIIPNSLVRKPQQPTFTEVRIAWKKRLQQAGQLRCKVFIKDQLPAE